MNFERKRPFRFSLRAMLVVVTVLCVLLVWVHHVNKQKRAVAWVVKNGGRVRYGTYDATGRSRYSVLRPEVSRRCRWLVKLIGIDYFATVVVVDLGESQESDLSPLANLPNLQALTIRNTLPQDLTQLGKLTKLKCLDIKYYEASDEELAKIWKLLPNCEIWTWRRIGLEPDPIRWLTENIRVEFPDDGEVMNSARQKTSEGQALTYESNRRNQV